MAISSFGAAHVAAAFAALAFGMMVLIMRKGTQLHRAMGMGYAMVMVAVNGTALTIYRLRSVRDPAARARLTVPLGVSAEPGALAGDFRHRPKLRPKGSDVSQRPAG
jgi:hypothetical protein